MAKSNIHEKMTRMSGSVRQIGCFLTCFCLSLAAAGLRAGEIHDAAAAGDLNKVKALLEADPTLLESKDGGRSTPLLSACAAQRVAVANFLLDKGANVKVRDRFQMTPLHRACYSYVQAQDLALIQRLIDKGADVNARGYNGLIPLHQAAQSAHPKVAQLLIDKGADVNTYDKYSGPVGSASISGTVLQVAINFNPKEEMAKLLVERGAKLNRKDAQGNTELHLAALKGYADLTRRLVEHGADVNAVNSHNRTALYYAARHGYRSVADVLIAAGAKESAIVEINYGKAPQLTATLKEGEAYLWYLGAGYAVKTKGHLVLFNPSEMDESSEAGLVNGHLNPSELAGQKVTVLVSTPERWPIAPAVFELAQRVPDADFVMSHTPAAAGTGNPAIPSYRLATPNESFSVSGIQVHTIPALGGGMGYLVEADGVKVLYAGLHVSSNENAMLAKYRQEIDYLKPFGPIDVALVSVSAHTNDIDNAYEPHLYLLDQLAPKAVYLFGANQSEQYSQCTEVLRGRNIPVAYPEANRAAGERFHYLQAPTRAAPLPSGTPASRSGPASASGDLLVTRLSPRLLQLKVRAPGIFGTNIVVVATQQGLVVIDTWHAPFIFDQVGAIVQQQFGRRDFAYVINSHEDVDHTGGNGFFQDVTMVGHERLFKSLSERHAGRRPWQTQYRGRIQGYLKGEEEKLAGLDKTTKEAAEIAAGVAVLKKLDRDFADGFPIIPESPKAIISFTDSKILDLGDITIECYACPAGHTRSDILIYIPQEGFLFTGDAAQVSVSKDVKMNAWLKQLDHFAGPDMPVKLILTGHGDAPFRQPDLAALRDYLKTTWDSVQEARAQGLSLAQIQTQCSLDTALSPFRSLADKPFNTGTLEQFKTKHSKNIETLANMNN